MNVFLYMFKITRPYLSLLLSHFVFWFSPSFSYSSLLERYPTIYNVWFNFIAACPYITEIRKTRYSSRRKKKCPVNHNQNKCSNIWYKVWVFLPPYSRSYSHIILWQKNLLTISHITKLQITFQNKKITTFNKISF